MDGTEGVLPLNTGVDREGISIEYGGGTEGVFPLNMDMFFLHF